MDPEKFTILQLKGVLAKMGLPQKGNKLELLKRLTEHDPTGSWMECYGLTHAEETPPREASEMSALPMADAGIDNDYRSQCKHRQEDARPLRDVESQFMRELDLMRREQDLMRREMEEIREERGHTRSESARSMFRQPPVSTLGELVGEFSGAEDSFEIWRQQLELVREGYELDDRQTRILIGMRLRKTALQWFRSQPEHLQITVKELMGKIKILFDIRPSKLELRKQFEKRSWKSEETFGTYYYDKVILAAKVPIAEDEIVDYVIAGIPDIGLRNQARMQRFQIKED